MITKPLTTGKVAKLLNVAPRTVSKWVDSGRLKGYRLPMSQDRRVLPDELLRFCTDEGIPVPNELAGCPLPLPPEPIDTSTRTIQAAIANLKAYLAGNAAMDYLPTDCHLVAATCETLLMGVEA